MEIILKPTVFRLITTKDYCCGVTTYYVILEAIKGNNLSVSSYMTTKNFLICGSGLFYLSQISSLTRNKIPKAVIKVLTPLEM